MGQSVVAVATLPPKTAASVNVDSIIRAYKEFPEKDIDGIRLVTKAVLPEQPRLIMLHFQNEHANPLAELIPSQFANSPAANDNNNLRVGEEIARGVTCLKEKMNIPISRIFLEGVHEGNFENFQQQRKLVQIVGPDKQEEALRGMATLQKESPELMRTICSSAIEVPITEGKKAYDTSLAFVEKFFSETGKERDAARAALIAIVEKFKKNPPPREQLGVTIEELKRKTEAVTKIEKKAGEFWTTAETKKIVGDDRENAVVENVWKASVHSSSYPESPYSPVIYGGGQHSFSNNIRDWNKQNPTQQIALIEITPVSLSSISTP